VLRSGLLRRVARVPPSRKRIQRLIIRTGGPCSVMAAVTAPFLELRLFRLWLACRS
jgi:hypothetical protein